MKYCSNCGRELDDYMKFCGACGAPQITAESQMEKTKKKSKWILIILTVVMIGVVSISSVLSQGNEFENTLDNNKETNVSENEVVEEINEKNTQIIWCCVEYFFDMGEKWTFCLGSEEIKDALSEKIEYDHEGYIKKIFWYDSDSTLVYTEDYMWDNNRNYLKCISYNRENKIDREAEWIYQDNISKGFKAWNSDGEVVREVQFNDCGNIVSETQYNAESVIHDEYVYDEEANLISKFCYKDEVLEEKYEYSYDEKGNQIKVEEWNLSENGDFFLATETKYIFDKNDNMISEVETYMRDTGEVSFYDRTEYSYDSDGKIIEEKNYDENSQIEDTVKYTYDEHGNRLSRVRINSEGNEYTREKWVWNAFRREK